MTDTTEATHEVKTIAEVEAIVNGSGMWDGTTPVEFSNDGETWTEAWAPTDGHGAPEFARVTVHRKDVTVPTRKTIRWDEHVPLADLFWLALWHKSPTRHFGRTVRMVAYRETFRDLLGTVRLEDEGELDKPTTPAPEPEPEPASASEPVSRDWLAEFAEAGDVDTLDQIVTDGRKAKVFKPNAEGTALDRAWRARRAELTAVAEAPVVERPAPRDRMPATRTATKRKRARRKGGKR